MALTWISGELNALTIEWLHIEAICEVNKDIELLTVKLSGITENLTGGGYFDNYLLLKNLLNEKTTGANIIYLPVPETSGEIEIPVFGSIVEIAEIVAAHIVPKFDIIGSDSDYMTLKLINKESSEVICTKTFLAGADALAYEVTDFGPANENNNAVNYGKGVSLVKEDTGGGMTLPQSVLIVEWNLG